MARNTAVTLGDHFDQFVSEKINAGRFHPNTLGQALKTTRKFNSLLATIVFSMES